ncbi:MAG: Fic family protein [Elusimicrobiota bacterium]|jgi:death-on-curing protein|nr:Fic family protein [Elusimicrobiota bacterium]
MIKFLTLNEVLIILQDQIRRYGGLYGVRDLILLSSAVYMPQSSFNGEYLYKTIPAMAAAYLFYISQNLPFIDGNKRTSLAVSLVFLDINGYALNCDNTAIYNETLKIAKEKIKKDILIEFYEKFAIKQ